jgi:hypothetical protein
MLAYKYIKHVIFLGQVHFGSERHKNTATGIFEFPIDRVTFDLLQMDS